MPVSTIAVIGAGTMGAGIAQLAATGGCAVILTDANAEALERGRSSIDSRIARSVEKGRLTEAEGKAASARITTRDRIADFGDVELAIEAVIENIDVKHDVFRALEAATSPTAVLATNTSSLSVSAIAEPLNHPGRVVGMHFFNPAPVMPLVEIIAGTQSEQAAGDTAFEAAKAWGKVPVRAKDTPGFIVNRVARGYYLEALRLLDEGVAGVYDIDQIMTAHGKFRMGPFTLMDLVGLDVNWSVSNSVWEQMGRPARLTPHPIQGGLVERGMLGRKTGEGFYRYDDERPVPSYPVELQSYEVSPLLSDALTAFALRSGALEANPTEQYIFARILGAIINEAAIAYDEGVASADDIDTAMKKGTNYPRGPLAWADDIGHNTVRGVLKSLNEVVQDDRYRPADFFQR